MNACVQVEYDSAVMGVRDIMELIERIGPYTTQLAQPERSVEALKREHEIQKWRFNFYASLVFTAPLVFVRYRQLHCHHHHHHLYHHHLHQHAIDRANLLPGSMVLSMMIKPTHELLQNDFFVSNLSIDAIVQWALATPVQFWLGWGFYVAAFKGNSTLSLSLSRLTPTTDLNLSTEARQRQHGRPCGAGHLRCLRLLRAEHHPPPGGRELRAPSLLRDLCTPHHLHHAGQVPHLSSPSPLLRLVVLVF